MALVVPRICPSCGLILLRGAIFDACEKQAEYGPILGLHKEARRETAQAGYVGLSSLHDPKNLRALYRCPKCGADPIIEDSEG